MKELQSVVLSGLGALTSRGDLTLGGTLELGTHNSEPATHSVNFKLEDYLPSQKTYLDRCSALALAGGALALRDAGLSWPLPADDAPHFGITLGTHLGCLATMKGFWDKAVERGMRLANPLLFSHSYFNSPISLCAIEFGLKGYHTTFCAGHDSGREALRAAHDAIRLGHAQAMLCGGVEAISEVRTQLASGENGEENREENGQAGEAAVFFVLESAAHAARRSATHALPVPDSFFDVDMAASEDLQRTLGDCGGAQNALVIALNCRRSAIA